MLSHKITVSSGMLGIIVCSTSKGLRALYSPAGGGSSDYDFDYAGAAYGPVHRNHSVGFTEYFI